MATSQRLQLVVDTAPGGVRVVRFLRADLREQLYDDADIHVCPLYLELFDRILADLQEGETLVLNLGLVESFPTAFYRCLLKVREHVRRCGANLILCRLSPEHEEIFRLFNSHKLFRVASTEGQAVYEAREARRRPAREGEGARCAP